MDVEKFTNLVILKFVDIATMYCQYTICNCMSYFYEFLNLTKKLMKIGSFRCIEETIVYDIPVFHTFMSAHTCIWKKILIDLQILICVGW